ncbi:MAG TPA: DUF1971 domain-containing protein [Pseudomonadaceae bacterium]|nr:DUF1971 domain-containing protein [Pseudomonadaceae bacterium]
MTDYRTANPGALPSGVVPYRRTGEFTEQTLPTGLRKDHSTKPGVWALIHVLEGRLRYCVPAWGYDEVLEPGRLGIVAPEVVHFVEPQGAVRVFVEFHAAAEQGPSDPHGMREGDLPAG